MQGTFILAIVCAVFAAVAGAVWVIARHMAKQPRRAPAGRRSDYDGDSRSGAEMTRFWSKIIAFALAGLSALLIIVSSFNVVGTQNIGIVTSFGRPVSYVGNGAQWIPPWDEVTDMDYAIQVTDFTASSCQVQLRLADGQTACAKVAVRWRINRAAADALFRNYKGSTLGIENGLLIPEVQNVANQVFAGYDPVKLLNSPDPAGSPKNPTVPQLAGQVQDQLSAKIGKEVEIISLFMPNITYSPQVQARINAVLAQKAQTLIAEQAVQTALAQATANNDINASVAKTPNVLISRCLDIMAEMVKGGQTPPVNMCNLYGGSTGVITGTGK